MVPSDLLKTARILADVHKTKPSQANLRKAASAAYYALFHEVAQNVANVLVGKSGARDENWRRVCRSIDHAAMRSACADVTTKQSPIGLEPVAETFAKLLESRQKADYDPFAVFTRADVTDLIVLAEAAIADFRKQSQTDRLSFAVRVCFKERR